MEPLVSVTELNRRFGSRQALSNVSLSMEKGEVLGLLGPNGAGKTTCLRLLSGMLAPTSGTVEIEGIDLARKPLEAKRRLGYLPERPPLHLDLRVDEYLSYCAKLRAIPRAESAAAIAKAKKRCGLDDSGKRLIAKLSKGYRQRLGIAQAIIHQPKLLILDEPTEGLDPVQMRELRSLIRELAKDCGVILSSHLLPEVQAVCDRVAILHEGSIHLDAPLATEQQSQVLRIRLAEPCAPERLSELNPVINAEDLGEGRYRVTIAARSTPADLASGIVRANLGLLELGPERSDLERVFFDLIGAEEQP